MDQKTISNAIDAIHNDRQMATGRMAIVLEKKFKYRRPTCTTIVNEIINEVINEVITSNEILHETLNKY